LVVLPFLEHSRRKILDYHNEEVNSEMANQQKETKADLELYVDQLEDTLDDIADLATDDEIEPADALDKIADVAEGDEDEEEGDADEGEE